ncbi:MAG: D-alanine--D-alanine ligase [Halobacteriovorax sp.]|nr:D-alanine--D-alanine ligase [Halobacteriovorax sp.]
MVLMHRDLVPKSGAKRSELDVDRCPWITELDVITALKKRGHEVLPLGIYGDLKPIRDAIEEFKPHATFNLLEEFDGEALFDQNVVSYLELLRQPYTGCNPRGLILARDKALAKKVLNYHRIKTPAFAEFPLWAGIKIPKELPYPCIVKCQMEEASLGISRSSVVRSKDKLIDRVNWIHDKLGYHAIAEEFIEGRELYVGVYGHQRLSTLPVWEVAFDKVLEPGKEIYTRMAKWNPDYRARKGIKSGPAKLSPALEKKVLDICKRTYRALHLSGYARIDLRVTEQGEIYVIEANPNPNIGRDDEFAESASRKGIKYDDLVEKVVSLAYARSTIYND